MTETEHLTEVNSVTAITRRYEVGVDGCVGKYRESNGGRRFTSVLNLLREVFLPQGYPDSVTEDYLPYQMWDTCQAFASSIVGTLATQAVLKGAGVGDESATVLAATLTWIYKDGVGMLGRIVFAWARGTELDADSKKWRLFADVLNDVAFFIDLLAAQFRSAFTLLVCLSSLLRSLVGVAGGATRASLTEHQARRNNLADVSAKDGSQETLVNLSALLLSYLIIPVVSGRTTLIWGLFIVLTAVHLFANFKAVRSLQMNTLNRHRMRILVQHYVRYQVVLTVKRANLREPLFSDYFNFWPKVELKFGRSIAECRSKMRVVMNETNTYGVGVVPRGNRHSIVVLLGNDSTVATMIEAAFLALVIEETLISGRQSDDDTAAVVDKCRLFCRDHLQDFLVGLDSSGWDLSHCLLAFGDWRIRVK